MSDLPTGTPAGAKPDDDPDANLEIDLGIEGEEIEPEPEDEIEPEPEDGAEPESVAAAPRGPKGKPYGQQIRELEAAREADKAEFRRQLDQLVAERRQPTQAELMAAEAARREAFDQMSPYDQHVFSLREASRLVEQRTQQIEIRNWQQNDKRTYDEELRSDPTLKRYDARVDDLHKQYPGVSLIDLLDKAIGEYARTHKAAARTRANGAAAAGTAAQTVRAPAGRSDVPADRGRNAEAAAYARLRAAGMIS